MITILALIFCGYGASSLTDDLGQNPKAETMQWIEGELQARHIPTDSDSLIKALESEKEPLVRMNAALLLGYRKEAKAKPVLWNVVRNDPESTVRESAAWSLAYMGEKDGVTALKDLIPKASGVQRQSFLAARLAELGDPSEYSYAVSAVKSKDTETRFLTVENLFPFLKFEGKQGGKVVDALEQLQALLHDKEGKVRAEVVSVLARAVPLYISRTKVEPQLETIAASDPDPAVRATAHRILSIWKMGGPAKP